MEKLSATEIMEMFFYRKNPFALKVKAGYYVPIKRDVTLADIQKHIDGLHIIGAYVAREDESCVWGVIDFDLESYREIAEKIVDKYKGSALFTCVRLEKSLSKGYHVWFFFAQVVNTGVVYQLLNIILGDFGLETGRSSKIDIFPRSAHLSGKRIGWLVKVPTEFMI